MMLDSTARRKAFRIAQALTVVAAGRVAYLFARYVPGAGVPRFEVENAATILGVLALVTVVLGGTPGRFEARADAGARAEVLAWCVAAVALYWPSITIGFLSDDFVLASRAARGEFGAVSADLFRPLPLVAWSLLLKIGAGAAGLHLLNAIMHGATAFLTRRLAVAFVAPRLAIAAGLLVLTFPASPEAVSWCAGVFDVSATMLCLLTVLVSRRYAAGDRMVDRVGLFACAAFALLSKETAAVVPLLVGLDAWMRRRLSKRLAIDLSVLAGVLAAVGALRLLHASSMVKRPMTKYVLQRWFFGSAGALLVPWHVDVLRTLPWIALLTVGVTLAMAVAFILTPQPADRVRALVGSASWALAATLPTVTFFFVAPDLQGGRYVYLAAIGWALTVAAFAEGLRHRVPRRLDLVAVATMVICGAIGVRVQQMPWTRAGQLAKTVQRAAADDPRLRGCDAVALADLPDNVDGAYVFKNGVDEAFAAMGFVVRSDATPSCRFAWDAGRRAFDRRAP